MFSEFENNTLNMQKNAMKVQISFKKIETQQQIMFIQVIDIILILYVFTYYKSFDTDEKRETAGELKEKETLIG